MELYSFAKLFSWDSHQSSISRNFKGIGFVSRWWWWCHKCPPNVFIRRLLIIFAFRFLHILIRHFYHSWSCFYFTPTCISVWLMRFFWWKLISSVSVKKTFYRSFFSFFFFLLLLVEWVGEVRCYFISSEAKSRGIQRHKRE